jgi:hypothetical protein
MEKVIAERSFSSSKTSTELPKARVKATATKSCPKLEQMNLVGMKLGIQQKDPPGTNNQGKNFQHPREHATP